MCKYLAWRSRSSGCLVSCDIGFQKAGMQVKLFLECSQSPNILRRKFRPTIGSSNDRSEKSECVKCGSVYTVQYLGRKKEGKKKSKTTGKMSKCEISLPPTNGSHRDVNGGGPSPEHGHMPQPTPLILDRRRVASSQKLLWGETSASHMHRDLKPLWTCCGWLFPRFHLFLQSARYNRH